MWFHRRNRAAKRRRKVTPFDESRLPPHAFLTVAESTEEGLLLTEYASRMAVKNVFLRETLGGSKKWGAERGREVAEATLESLARESENDAKNLDNIIARFHMNPNSERDLHGYSYDDTENMEHRRDVSREVARRLREQSADESYLTSLVDRARRDAWREVAANIENNLDIENLPMDADYERHREERMRALVAEDLTQLEASRREDAKEMSTPHPTPTA